MSDREKMIEVILKWDDDFWGGEIGDYCAISSLSDSLFDAGYRLDPYPNGKSRIDLIAMIDERESIIAKTKNLLRAEHEWSIKAVIGTESDTLAEAMEIHRRRKPTCSICAFLTETSTVKS